MVSIEKFFKNGGNKTKYLLKVILYVAKACVYWESWIFSKGKKGPPISVFAAYQFESKTLWNPK